MLSANSLSGANSIVELSIEGIKVPMPFICTFSPLIKALPTNANNSFIKSSVVLVEPPVDVDSNSANC